MYRMNGVVPPMITPFTQSGELDLEGLKTLVNYLSENVHGLFICGSYGCGPMMDVEERKKVTEVTLAENKGKVDVIAHVGSTSTRTSVELTKHAAAQGVQAVAAVGPYYFHHQRDSVLSFYEDLVKAANGVPVYVYNNPGFQGYTMDLNLVKGLRDVGVHGIKDATFNIIEHAAYHRVLGDSFDIALGTEAMFLSAAALGTRAFIPGLGNAFPEMNVQMFEEAMRKDFDACRTTQFLINQMRDVMYLARSTQLAVYAMLELRGIVTTYPRKPFLSASEEEKTRMRNALKELNVL
ncbi:MAG: dihydrodipicolinate synthase family protein [Spirochaetae bacterium HGW-Spirochaetae-4]|jgi:dihydrodipicolinate synthase/N-acetylneuraminate lyase|nr:MAG: dihydrodipicolinate synthase family protein [Spirochaetae bacterium HGW-Spirochaetae-4]